MKLGIDCGGTKTEAIVLNGNRIVDHIKVNSTSTKNVVFDLISYMKKKHKLKFVGIGFPAPIDHGFIREVNNIKGWNNCRLDFEVKKRFGIRCKVDNDAKCFALAEARQNENKRFDTVVGITLGTGLGVAVVINGKLFSGKRGIAGEIGRFPMTQQSKSEKAGYTLEDLTSKKFFIKGFGIEPKDLLTAKKPSKNKKKIIDAYARNLGNMIALICLAYDPDCIVIGGSISKSWTKLSKLALMTAKSSLYTIQKKQLVVKQSKLQYSSCIGAALL